MGRRWKQSNVKNGIKARGMDPEMHSIGAEVPT